MKKVYVGMGAVIEKENKYLIVKRSPDRDFAPNIWEVVTGRLDEDEHPVKGIVREIMEETGLEAKVLMTLNTGFFYRGGKEFPMVFITYLCKYLSGKVKLDWEHTEFKWITLEEALEMKDLLHFHTEFENIKKLKEFVPEDFELEVRTEIM